MSDSSGNVQPMGGPIRFKYEPVGDSLTMVGDNGHRTPLLRVSGLKTETDLFRAK